MLKRIIKIVLFLSIIVNNLNALTEMKSVKNSDGTTTTIFVSSKELFKYTKKYSMFGMSSSMTYQFFIKMDKQTLMVYKKLIPNKFSYALYEKEVYNLDINNIMEISLNTPIKANTTIGDTTYNNDTYSLTISTWPHETKYFKVNRGIKVDKNKPLKSQEYKTQFVVISSNNAEDIMRIKEILLKINPDITLNDYKDFTKKVTILPGGLCYAECASGMLEIYLPAGIQDEFEYGRCIKNNKTLTGYVTDKKTGKYGIKVKTYYSKSVKEFFWVPPSLIQSEKTKK